MHVSRHEFSIRDSAEGLAHGEPFLAANAAYPTARFGRLRSEDDTQTIRRVASRPTDRGGIITIEDLEVTGLSGAEAAVRNQASDRPVERPPSSIRRTDVAGRIRRASSVIAQVLADATEPVVEGVTDTGTHRARTRQRKLIVSGPQNRKTQWCGAIDGEAQRVRGHARVSVSHERAVASG